MVVQIIVRTSRGLAITQLEIAVMAFSVCAVILYILNWRKPKNIKTAFTLAIFPGDIPDEIERHVRAKYDTRQRLSYQFSLDSAFDKERAGDPIPNDRIHLTKADHGVIHLLVGLAFGCSIFGGIHVAAWNFNFPTRVELIFWRVASIWCTVFALVSITLVISMATAGHFLNIIDEIKSLVVAIMRIFLALYVICRLILLVEIFRTLFFLPPDAFIATSASNIPHVA
jgi:hypothetical protein